MKFSKTGGLFRRGVAAIFSTLLCMCLIPLATAQDIDEQEKDVKVVIRRDGKPVDLKKEKLNICWRPDERPSSLYCECLEREGGVARAMIKAEPGHFVIDRVTSGIDPGEYRDWKFKPRWSAKRKIEICFDLVSGGISGKVMTTDGDPVPGAHLVISLEKPATLPEHVESIDLCLQPRADDTGAFHVADLVPGRYKVIVHGDTNAAGWYEHGDLKFLPSVPGLFEVTHEGSRWIVEPRILELNRRVELRVTQADKPLAGVPVKAELQWWRTPEKKSDELREEFVLEGKTESHGRWEGLFVDGWLRLTVAVPHLGDIIGYETIKKDASPLKLELRIPPMKDLPHVTGTVEDFQELPSAYKGAKVEWKVMLYSVPDAGEEPPTRIDFASFREVPVGNDGRFDLGRVLPGRDFVSLRGYPLPKSGVDTGKLFVELMHKFPWGENFEVRLGQKLNVFLRKSQ